MDSKRRPKAAKAANKMIADVLSWDIAEAVKTRWIIRILRMTGHLTDVPVIIRGSSISQKLLLWTQLKLHAPLRAKDLSYQRLTCNDIRREIEEASHAVCDALVTFGD